MGPGPADDRVVIVNGAPASGKTSIARPLAKRFGMALIEKDRIKEPLFDVLGTGDAEWSRRLSDASFEVMFALADSAGAVMVEGNFRREHAERFARAGRQTLEIYCFCSDEELLRRFESRAEDRHPGHHLLPRDELLDRARLGPLNVGGPLLRVDTGSDDAYERATEWLRMNGFAEQDQ